MDPLLICPIFHKKRFKYKINLKRIKVYSQKKWTYLPSSLSVIIIDLNPICVTWRSEEFSGELIYGHVYEESFWYLHN